MDGRRPRVFVSYAHDSDRHKRAVLRLCTLLRDESDLDVHVDQWSDNDRQDWSLWAMEQVDSADFVVVVASPAYKPRAEGRVAFNVGRGSQFEAALLRDKLTENWSEWTRKIIPVVLPGQSVADIPAFLQPYAATHYLITELTAAGLAELVGVLRGRPASKGPTMANSDWDADGPAPSPRQTAFSAENSSVQQAGRDIRINNFPVLPVGIGVAVIVILVAVWLIWLGREGNAEASWREVLRWKGYSLKPADFSCTDGVVDKVDLDTGKPGRGWQVQILPCKADGGNAELVLEWTDVHSFSPEVRSILVVPDGADLTAEACDSMIKSSEAELRQSIRLADLRAGSKACVRTDKDRIAGVTFTHIPTGRDPHLKIDFVVWESGG